MEAAVLSVARGVYLTDGKRLCYVLSASEDSVLVEDAETFQCDIVPLESLAAEGWRAIERG